MAITQKLEMVLTAQNKATKEIEKVQGSLKKLGETATEVSESSSMSFAEMTGSFALGSIAGDLLIDALYGISSSIVNLVKESIIMTGEFRQSKETFYGLAGAIGWTSEEIKTMQQFLQDSNKDAATSVEIMKKLALAQMEASDAEQLLTRGRDIAAAVNKNSNEVIMQMTEAVATGNGQMMRQLGIMVDVGPAIQNYANKHKISADEVRKHHRQTAIFDEIMRQSEHTIGSYDRAMDSWYKKMNSCRDMSGNLRLAIGQLLDGAMKPIIEKTYDALKAFTKWALEADGTLKPQLIVLRNVIGLVTEGIFHLLWAVGELIVKGMKWLLDWIEKDVNGMNWFAKTIKGLSNFLIALYKTFKHGLVVIGAFGNSVVGTGKILVAFVKDGIKNFKNFSEILKKSFGSIWKAMKGDFKGAWEDIKDGIEESLSNTIAEFDNFKNEQEEVSKAIEISANEAAEAWKDFFDMKGMDEMVAKFKDINDQTDEGGKLLGAFLDMFKKTGEKVPADLKKIEDAMKKQKTAMESVINSLKRFKDKVTDIKNAIKDESIAFMKAQKEKAMTYKERLAEMVADHKEKWQQANREREEIERKGIKGREDLIKVAELRAEAEKEFKIIQPYLNREDLRKLAERTDIEKLTGVYRREQAEETVEVGRRREEMQVEARQLIFNFDLRDATITDENFIDMIKRELNNALATANITM